MTSRRELGVVDLGGVSCDIKEDAAALDAVLCPVVDAEAGVLRLGGRAEGDLAIALRDIGCLDAAVKEADVAAASLRGAH
jgi:hypothetical protein